MPISVTSARVGNAPSENSLLACVEQTLLARHPARQSGDVPDATIETLTDAVLMSDDALAQPLARVRLRHGLTAEGVMLRLLAPISRRLGERWTADTVDFCDVTLGVIRLRRALRRLSIETTEPPADPGPRRIALWTVPGDQHRFGTVMLAAIFARRGWTVVDMPIERPEDIGRQLRIHPCSVVGLSIGNERLLPTLIACVDAIRLTGAALMVGGALLEAQPDLVSVVGADGAATDGVSAVHEAERLHLVRKAAAGVPAIMQPRVAAGWIG